MSLTEAGFEHVTVRSRVQYFSNLRPVRLVCGLQRDVPISTLSSVCGLHRDVPISTLSSVCGLHRDVPILIPHFGSPMVDWT